MFHQKCLRRILRIKWFIKTSNETALQCAAITNVAIDLESLGLTVLKSTTRPLLDQSLTAET